MSLLCTCTKSATAWHANQIVICYWDLESKHLNMWTFSASIRVGLGETAKAPLLSAAEGPKPGKKPGRCLGILFGACWNGQCVRKTSNEYPKLDKKVGSAWWLWMHLRQFLCAHMSWFGACWVDQGGSSEMACSYFCLGAMRGAFEYGQKEDREGRGSWAGSGATRIPWEVGQLAKLALPTTLSWHFPDSARDFEVF